MTTDKINFFKAFSFIFPVQSIITTLVVVIFLLIFGELENSFSAYDIFNYTIFNFSVFVLSMLFYIFCKKISLKFVIYFIGLILISFIVLFLNLDRNKAAEEVTFLIILNFICSSIIITSIYKIKAGAILVFIFLIILFIILLMLGVTIGEGGLALMFLSVILLPHYFTVLFISKKLKNFFISKDYPEIKLINLP